MRLLHNCLFFPQLSSVFSKDCDFEIFKGHSSCRLKHTEVRLSNRQSNSSSFLCLLGVSDRLLKGSGLNKSTDTNWEQSQKVWL